MRIPRFYYPNYLAIGELTLEDDTAKRISKVLRMQEGEEIILFNNTGKQFKANINKIFKTQITINIFQEEITKTESPLTLELTQAVSNKDTMDLAIQKAVELGVTSISPIITTFSQMKINNHILAKKHEHWQKVIISACEQCGRNFIPTLNLTQSIDSWLKNLNKNTVRLVANPRAKFNFAGLTKPKDNIIILIGPEGGFSEEEITTLEKENFMSIKLGPRILRLETATIAALTLIQHYFGDLD